MGAGRGRKVALVGNEAGQCHLDDFVGNAMNFVLPSGWEGDHSQGNGRRKVMMLDDFT